MTTERGRALTVRSLSFRWTSLFLPILLLLAFAGCSAPATDSVPAPTEAASTPAPPPESAVTVGERIFSTEEKILDYSQSPVPVDALCRAAGEFTNVEKILLGVTDLDISRIDAICAAFPEARDEWQVALPCDIIDGCTRFLDLSALSDEQIEQTCSSLSLLPKLEKISLLSSEGLTVQGTETLQKLTDAAPDAEIEFSYELYGQRVGSDTLELRYSETDVGDDGIEVFRAVLPYMKKLTLLRFYDCGIKDNDAMAALRSDFPDVNVVWSIEITGSLFMTDTTLLHNPLLRDKHVHLLRYFPDILYLDIGHNHYLTSVDFIRYLPKLQVAILAITRISDISALANCPDLEFCELFNSHIEDLSPLAGLKKLEYLNIGDMPFVRDISPLYGLESLKMVRICGSTFNWVKQDQVDELKARLPNCLVSDGGGDPTTSGGWRWDINHVYTERYALLRQQMNYDEPNWKKRQSNSPSALPDEQAG